MWLSHTHTHAGVHFPRLHTRQVLRPSSDVLSHVYRHNSSSLSEFFPRLSSTWSRMHTFHRVGSQHCYCNTSIPFRNRLQCQKKRNRKSDNLNIASASNPVLRTVGLDGCSSHSATLRFRHLSKIWFLQSILPVCLSFYLPVIYSYFICQFNWFSYRKAHCSPPPHCAKSEMHPTVLVSSSPQCG